MRIFIISHDLGHNCLGRAVVLAQAFGRNHEVEIVGPCFAPDIWFPGRDLGFKYRKVDGELFLPQFTHLFARLIDKLKGDVVLAVKPRPTSFGVALMHRELTGRPVILDIDDDEIGWYEGREWKDWDRKTLLRRPNSPLYTALLEKLIPTADAVTVASHALRQKYGGTHLTHVKDPAFLDPARYDKAALRDRAGFPPEEKLIVFAGSPREHKGLEALLGAVEALGRTDVKLLVVGASNDPDNAYEANLRRRGGERLYMLKQTTMKELPAVLAMGDLVVLPQDESATARAQMPSKLFDAMAMALPIAATGVSDIPEALADDCGLIVPPNDAPALVEAMRAVLNSPDRARELGANARRRLIDRYSIDAAQPTVEAVVEKVKWFRDERQGKTRSRTRSA